MVGLGWLSVALAAQVQLRVEPTELFEGQTGTARVLVVADGSEGASGTRPPELMVEEGLQVGSVSQLQEFRRHNGRITQIRQFEYAIAALSEGTWTIGPVAITLDGGTVLETNAVQVTVNPRPLAGIAQPEVLAEAGFDVESAYEGQLVLYRYRFESRIPGATAEWRLPDFDGLRIPQQGQAVQSTYTIDDPEGKIAVQLGVVPLIATGTGRRDQGAAVANVKIPVGPPTTFGFRRVRTEPWATEPSVLEIESLPEPPDAFSGLIGDFRVVSSLDRKVAAVGQSITWNLQILGDGALEGFSLPAYAADGITTYEADDHVSARVDGGAYAASAVFRRILVPTEEGRLNPPPFELVTFSPTRGEYVVHTERLPEIHVVPGREGNGEVTSFATEPGAIPEAAPEDLAPRPIVASGFGSTWAIGRATPWLLGLAAGPGIGIVAADALFAGLVLWRRRRQDQIAPPTPAQLVENLPSDPRTRLATLDTALRGALAEGPDPDLEALLEQLQRARFAEGTEDPDLVRKIVGAISRRSS